jgi:hypothetical protein
MKAAAKAFLITLIIIALAVPLASQKAGGAKDTKKVDATKAAEQVEATPELMKRQAAGPKYDPSAEVKLKGSIEEVKNIAEHTHLLIRTAGQLQEVYLAPADFLADLECSFSKGDEVEIVGSKVRLESGVERVLVRQLVRGQLTLTLRDPKGAPVWDWKRG